MSVLIVGKNLCHMIIFIYATEKTHRLKNLFIRVYIFITKNYLFRIITAEQIHFLFRFDTIANVPHRCENKSIIFDFSRIISSSS